MITYLPYFTHQTNLCVGEIFKESDIYKATANKAAHITTYFKSKNHVYFAGKLRDIQMQTYKKLQALIVPGDTRWNSYYYCYFIYRPISKI